MSLLLAFAAAAIARLAGNVGQALQLERTAIAAGEWWRLMTCHFTHWSADHFAWDVMTFALLGAACEATSRRRMLVALLTSAIAIPLAVLAFQPQLQTYRGLSGLGSALFGLLAVELLCQRIAAADRRSVVAIGLLIVAFCAKTTIETVTGTAAFVDSRGAGFVPVPLAHLLGFVIGGAAPLAPRRRESVDRHPRLAPLRWPAI